MRPAVLPAPVQQLDQRGVIADIVVIRRKFERARQVGECFIEPSEPIVHIAAIGVRMCQSRIERNGGGEISERRVVAVFQHQRRAARVMGGRVLRMQRDRAVEALDRLRPAPERQQGERAIEPGFGKIGAGGDRAFETVQREFGAAEPLLRHADEIVGRGVSRIELDRLAAEFDALGQAALLALDRRQQKERIDIFLVLRQHLLVARRCLGELSLPMQRRCLLHQE